MFRKSLPAAFMLIFALLFLSVGCIPMLNPIAAVQPLTGIAAQKAPPPAPEPGKLDMASNTGQVQLAHVINTGTITIGMPGPLEAVPPEPPHEESAASPPEAMPDPAKGQIKEDEGLRLFPYSCSPEKGSFTIGYGRNLSTNGITPLEAEMMFETDFARARADLEQIFNKEWEGLPVDIQGVLTNMRFQMGHRGFRSFTGMIAAVRAGNWHGMAEEMKDSLWYLKTTDRAESLIRIVEKHINLNE